MIMMGEHAFFLIHLCYWGEVGQSSLCCKATIFIFFHHSLLLFRQYSHLSCGLPHFLRPPRFFCLHHLRRSVVFHSDDGSSVFHSACVLNKNFANAIPGKHDLLSKHFLLISPLVILWKLLSLEKSCQQIVCLPLQMPAGLERVT